MSKNISIDEVKKLAELSQIKLSEGEAESLVADLDRILDYVRQLESVDTKGIQPTSQVTGLKNVSRNDETIDYGLGREQLLSNVPTLKDGQIKTNRIL